MTNGVITQGLLCKMRVLEVFIQRRGSPSWGESWKKKKNDSLLIYQSAYSALYTESRLLLTLLEISDTKMSVCTDTYLIWWQPDKCYCGTLCNIKYSIFPFSNYPEEQSFLINNYINMNNVYFIFSSDIVFLIGQMICIYAGIMMYDGFWHLYDLCCCNLYLLCVFSFH